MRRLDGRLRPVQPILRRSVAFFVPSAMLLTLVCGLVYAAVQQNLRSSANDPQIQLAEDAAAHLNAGVAPEALVGADSVDIARSLAPFVAIYDATGAVLATDGVLDGQPPRPPAGVLASATATGRDIVTWQPPSGVRIALVVIPWQGGTVAAGRSLRIVEEREDNALLLTLVAWMLGLAAVAIAAVVAARLWPDQGPPVRPPRQPV